MDTSNYLAIGDFAKRSGIKRKALIYYDQMGFFKPEIVDEKGYRYYHYHQLYAANKLLFLKDIGMSLKEIEKNMYGVSDSKEMIQLLQQQKELVIKKQQYYQQMQELIEMQQQLLLESQNVNFSEILIMQQTATPLFSCKEVINAEYPRMSLAISALYQKTLAYGYEFPYPPGMMVNLPAANGEFCFKNTTYYTKVPTSDVYRPAGKYLACYVQGDMDYQGAFIEMQAYAEEKGIELVGNLYIDFILNELVSQNFDKFILKLQIAIKELIFY
ncbi:DNA-binding transcriptional MerR regulator [Enterococcus sp. PF1-24]|uniref:MerR family transcriptional regulator n=1 Tax=unclassified Enterococcus TaxID=2608891 RepID=UPI002472F256|nr:MULTISPECIES: MerR family transcriptional regulator [unclassified Enterococcus]MDH6364988.1 DNA-binding transcriptional MerR regulator [Enterococcus sp. PFB1-1]MDH6402089.1 DNA-binding transcriptional MerR regulator [Enterococcus sp. PF1-24]